jgi:hypothetical protein
MRADLGLTTPFLVDTPRRGGDIMFIFVVRRLGCLQGEQPASALGHAA